MAQARHKAASSARSRQKADPDASGGKGAGTRPAVRRGRQARKAPAADKSAAGKGATGRGAAAGGGGRAASGRRTDTARVRVMAQGRAANAEHRQAAQAMGRLLREVCGIVAAFTALITLLALVTFDQSDPGWSHTGEGRAVHNSVGWAGAWFADVAFYLFGFMAYLVPLLLALGGWALFRGARRREPGYRPFMFIRLIGVVLMFVTASGLADLHAAVPDGALPEGSYGGGILGTLTAWRLVAFMHPLGATLLLLGLFFCSLTLAFGTSWIQFIEWLGGAVLRSVDWVRDQYSSTADARRERELRQRAMDEAALDSWSSSAGALPEDTAEDYPQPEPAARAVVRKTRKSRSATGGPAADSTAQEATAAASAPEADTVSPADPPMETSPKRRAAARWIGRRADSDEADPLLDSLPEAADEASPGVGLAAALRLARSSRQTPAETEDQAAPAEGADGRIPLGSGKGSSSEKFDAMADALDRSLTLDTGQSGEREPGSRAVMKAARALKIAERADRVSPASSDFDPLEAARAASLAEAGPAAARPPAGPPAGSAPADPQALVTAAPAAVDVDAPTVKRPAVKPRAPEQKQARLFLDVPDTDLPPLSLLDAPEPQRAGFSREELEALSRLLEEKLAEFRIEVEVVAVHPGPVITSFEMQPAPGIKASRITGLAQDIARSMSLPSVRVVEVIPGKSTIGIEVPNDHREIVQLSEMLQSEAYARQKSPLTLALGKDISGHAVTADLARMPHLLVAGTTGSGKSVAVNAMLISLLYKSTAKDVRLILIDPKMLELNVYDDIPHLLAPVVTDMNEAANALRWCVGEMERRYTLMAALKVRNLAGYNKKIADAEASGIPVTDPTWQAELSLDPSGPPPVLEPMPMIVVVVDEFADMMMQVGKKAEELITRIAQKARAAGIHLVLATQRPSVDVITGLIKANVPSRIAFQVSQKIDSRTIIDQGGAESLLGHGDMLYLPPGTGVPIRVHGAFVDDHEVHNVVSHIKQSGPPNYIEEILQENTAVIPGISGGSDDSDAETDALYDQAVAIVLESRKASISYVQRRLKIGYNRAARMIEDMENAGVVSTVTGNGTREVLAPPPGG